MSQIFFGAVVGNLSGTMSYVTLVWLREFFDLPLGSAEEGAVFSLAIASPVVSAKPDWFPAEVSEGPPPASAKTQFRRNSRRRVWPQYECFHRLERVDGPISTRTITQLGMPTRAREKSLARASYDFAELLARAEAPR